MAFNETGIERKRNGIALYWHGAVCISGTRMRLLTSLEANCFSSGRLHVSDRHWPSRAVSSTEKRSLQQQTTTSSMEQRQLGNTRAVNFSISCPRAWVWYLVNALRVPERNGNGTEIQWWCAGDRMANGRARVTFTRNRMETSPFLWCLLYMYMTTYSSLPSRSHT